MTGRRAAGALAGAVGVAAGLLACAVVGAALLVALGLPAQGRADTAAAEPAPALPPAELVVALSLGDPALQAGVVRQGRVILARGFEVEVARLLARRLRAGELRFVDVRPSSRLMTAGRPSWELAVASVKPTRAVAAVADLSLAYLPTDQAVIARRNLPRPRSLADLRGRKLCAERGSEGAVAIGATVRPKATPLLAPSPERLLMLVQTGVCDAALVDSIAVGRLVAGKGSRFGAIVTRVEHGEGLVVAVTRGGSVAVADVNRALRRLRGDGTLHRLARTWLGIDPAGLRTLR